MQMDYSESEYDLYFNIYLGTFGFSFLLSKIAILVISDRRF